MGIDERNAYLRGLEAGGKDFGRGEASLVTLGREPICECSGGG